MAKKELNEMTTTELKEQAKSLKIVAWTLVVLLLVLFCYAFYLTVKDGKMQIGIVVPIALFPIALASFGKLKKINLEIKSRSNQ